MKKANDFKNTYGPWSLIAYQNEKMVKKYAELLAINGVNLILLSSDEQSLARKAAEISNKFGIEIRTITANSTVDDIERTIGGLKIGYTVHNSEFDPLVEKITKIAEDKLETKEAVEVNSLRRDQSSTFSNQEYRSDRVETKVRGNNQVRKQVVNYIVNRGSSLFKKENTPVSRSSKFPLLDELVFLMKLLTVYSTDSAYRKSFRGLKTAKS